MKIQIVTLTMMTLMLSAGPLIAMDSEFREKRHEALHEEIKGASQKAQRPTEQQRKRELSQRDDGQHRHVDEDWQKWEQTREALRYWWR